MLSGRLQGQKEVSRALLRWMPINYQSTANMSLEWGYGHGRNQSEKPSKEIYIVVCIQLPSASCDTEGSGEYMTELRAQAWREEGWVMKTERWMLLSNCSEVSQSVSQWVRSVPCSTDSHSPVSSNDASIQCKDRILTKQSMTHCDVCYITYITFYKGKKEMLKPSQVYSWSIQQWYQIDIRYWLIHCKSWISASVVTRWWNFPSTALKNQRITNRLMLSRTSWIFSTFSTLLLWGASPERWTRLCLNLQTFLLYILSMTSLIFVSTPTKPAVSRFSWSTRAWKPRRETRPFPGSKASFTTNVHQLLLEPPTTSCTGDHTTVVSG